MIRKEDWLFCFMVYQTFLGHLMPNQILNNSVQYKYWFGLVSLFNGISTFVGYLMPKPFS